MCSLISFRRCCDCAVYDFHDALFEVAFDDERTVLDILNTIGHMVLCGKSLAGLQFLSEMIRDRKVRKTYLAAVAGNFEKAFEEKVYFTKDASKNRVLITDSQTPESEEMITAFEPVFHRDDCSLLKAELITGKPHQIRAHLSYRNYPVLGDPKYGDPGINREMKERYGLTRQMLHSCASADLRPPASISNTAK